MGVFEWLFSYEEPPEEKQPEIDEEDLPHGPEPDMEVEGFQELNDRINENQTVGMEDGMEGFEDDDEDEEEDEEDEL
jgi:hypothetical protein